MKTNLTVLVLLVLLSITGYSQTLDGSWKGSMSSPNGEFNLVFTFKVTDSALSGDVKSDMGTLPIENGKVTGKGFSFDLNVNGQVINHTGILDGDIIKLSVPMMEDPMLLSRVEEKPKTDGTSKISGVWKGKISSPQGDMELTFTFKVDGNSLTGKNSSAMGDAELINGKVNGNEFSFDVDAQGMIIGHKCKYLDDDSINVKANVMDQEFDMKLTRAE